MENNSKKRITIEIAGVSLNIVTDENEEFVQKIAETLDDRIAKMRKNSFTISVLDAALLCALENISDRFAAEKQIRSLQAQLSLCEMNMRNLRDEITVLKEQARASATQPKTDGGSQISLEVNTPDTPAEGILGSLGVSDSTPEEKISALEKYLENKRTTENPAGTTRADKIKYIESLLRGGISTND